MSKEELRSLDVSDMKVNETIVNMINNLKPTSKRALSSTNSSIDENYVTPAKKSRAEFSLDNSYLGSPREVRRLRAELEYSRSVILNLENRIKHMHGVRKETQIMFDSEVSILRQQHERDQKSIEELEAQLQSLRKREAGLKEELVEVNHKYSSLKVTTDEKIEDLEKLLSETNADKQMYEDEENTELTSLRRKLNDLEYVYQAAEEDLEAHKKMVADMEERLTKQNALERELELKDHALQKAKLHIKDLEYLKESYKEFQDQAKIQQYKISTYGKLEKETVKLREEVKKLKDEVQNKLILEEQVHDLKTRLSKFQEQEKKLQALQVTSAQNELYLEEWRAVARGICESSASDNLLPRLLRNTVEHLQQQEITLTSEKVHLESQLSTAVHDAKVAKAEVEKIQTHLTELQTNVQERQNLIHRMKRKLALVTRERDSYRLQLDSYERDLTICVNPASSAQPGANQLQTYKARIDDLEKMLESYREMVQKLENDLQTREAGSNSDLAPVKVDQLNRLQDELDKLKSENQQLRDRKDQLEIQMEEFLVGQDQVQGRVLHPTSNPLMDRVNQRETETEKLQEEVLKLRRKVKNLEDGLEASKLDVSVCPKEVMTLKEQIKSSEANTQRLKDFYKSAMQEFRNVIYMLLGYKIDRVSNSSLYKLTSMYAERPEDQICFQLNSEGALNLLENNFSKALEEMVELHLRHQKSIPVFLSAITMDLFNNRTTYN